MKTVVTITFILSLISVSGNILAGNLTTCSGDAFDADGYLLVNPDVKAAGIDACEHYKSHGKNEGRSPNPKNLGGQDTGTSGGNDGLINCNGDLFDPDGYLLVNSDVKSAGVNACEHYKSHGKNEGRSPNPKNRGGQNTGTSGGSGGGDGSNGGNQGNNGGSNGGNQGNNGGSNGGNQGNPPSGSGELLNGAADWQKWLPTSIGEVWYNNPTTSDTISYHHVTHSILNMQSAYNAGLKAIGHLKVQGKSSGIVFAESIQKQGAIRDDMTGENKYGNNHPMNVYGVGLGKDSVLKLPKNEIIVFIWTNKGTTKIMADLIHPNPDPSKNFSFKHCLNPGDSTTIEYNPQDFADLKPWHQDIKSNMNAYGDCY